MNLKNFDDFLGESSNDHYVPGLPDASNTPIEGKELKNYMFFQNLKTIQKSVECMLDMNAEKVDELLHDHDWANDHISSSQDDIEEVCNFLCNMIGKNQEKKEKEN